VPGPVFTVGSRPAKDVSVHAPDDLEALAAHIKAKAEPGRLHSARPSRNPTDTRCLSPLVGRRRCKTDPSREREPGLTRSSSRAPRVAHPLADAFAFQVSLLRHDKPPGAGSL